LTILFYFPVDANMCQVGMFGSAASLSPTILASS